MIPAVLLKTWLHKIEAFLGLAGVLTGYWGQLHVTANRAIAKHLHACHHLVTILVLKNRVKALL